MSIAATIQEEGERLNRFIGNLLDMTRLESGSLKPNADLVDISDLVGAALQRAQKILKDHKIATDVEAGLPMLSLDAVLMEQVLFNLLDNAAKYAPSGSKITIGAQRKNDKVVITIADEGEAFRQRIASRFSTSSTASIAATVSASAPAWARHLPGLCRSNERHDHRG